MKKRVKEQKIEGLCSIKHFAAVGEAETRAWANQFAA
jgi:hypothetical protein